MATGFGASRRKAAWMQTLPKVSEWKGPYHASRACLETIRRLKAIAAA